MKYKLPKKEPIYFEWGHFMEFTLFPDGEIIRRTIGSRGHEKFRPSFKQKMQLIIRILFR